MKTFKCQITSFLFVSDAIDKVQTLSLHQFLDSPCRDAFYGGMDDDGILCITPTLQGYAEAPYFPKRTEECILSAEAVPRVCVLPSRSGQAQPMPAEPAEQSAAEVTVPAVRQKSKRALSKPPVLDISLNVENILPSTRRSQSSFGDFASSASAAVSTILVPPPPTKKQLKQLEKEKKAAAKAEKAAKATTKPTRKAKAPAAVPQVAVAKAVKEKVQRQVKEKPPTVAKEPPPAESTTETLLKQLLHSQQDMMNAIFSSVVQKEKDKTAHTASIDKHIDKHFGKHFGDLTDTLLKSAARDRENLAAARDRENLAAAEQVRASAAAAAAAAAKSKRPCLEADSPSPPPVRKHRRSEYEQNFSPPRYSAAPGRCPPAASTSSGSESQIPYQLHMQMMKVQQDAMLNAQGLQAANMYFANFAPKR